MDEDECTRKILKGLLTRAGYGVELAANGKEALELVDAGPLPAVILLDPQMPVMSGFEVLSAMRSNPAWAAIPAIIVTASEVPSRAVVRSVRKKLGERASCVETVTGVGYRFRAR